MGNTFGELFRLTTYGESHGRAVGGVIDGMVPGIPLDEAVIQRQLDRRRPGQSDITTARREADRVEILSGVMDGLTTGTPIGFEVRNADHRSADYDAMRDVYRPSHADYTYAAKYGIRDHRGGGRTSARETIARVVGGAVAMEALKPSGINVYAYTSRVGDIALPDDYPVDASLIDANTVRCPDPDTAARMEALIRQVKADGDTIGGVVTGIATGLPAGLGEPVFDKLGARLAYAMMGINAAKGFEIGMGFAGVGNRGSEMADLFIPGAPGEPLRTATNNSGGIQGGLSNGMPLVFRVAFKPVATLLRPVSTVDARHAPTVLQAKGRHDPCVLPRAVPIVEAMAAMTVLDFILLDSRLNNWRP